MLAHYLQTRPDWGEAVIDLVVAEADFEGDSKHFPYVEGGGDEESERTAEKITELAQLIARKQQLES